MKNDNNNSKNIRRICKENGISFNDVAKQMHITPRKLDEFDINPGNMNIFQVNKISTILNCSIDNIVFGTRKASIDISFLKEKDLLKVLLLLGNEEMNNKRIIKKLIDSDEIIDKNYENVGKRIRYVRTNVLGYSQTELSNFFGVSRTSVEFWEQNYNLSKITNIISLSILSCISLDYFLKDSYSLEISSYNLDEKLYDVLTEIVEYFRDCYEKE
ncbi:MAG: hypothetical protein Q4C49_02865 [Bacillota bacterium]|nr:hypothetical protein [Bacillota bacterium]